MRTVCEDLYEIRRNADLKISTNEKRLRQRETFKRLINLGLTVVCLGLEIGIFAWHWISYFQYSIVDEMRKYWFKGHLLEISIYGAVLFFLSAMYGGMRLGYLKNVELIFSQVFATLIANVMIYAELSVMAFRLFVPDVFFLMMIEQTAVVIVYINVANRIYRSIFPPRKLLLIYGDRPAENLLDKFESRQDKYVVTRTIHIKEGFNKISRVILETYEKDECNAVVLGDISVADRTPLLKFCFLAIFQVLQ